MTDDEERIDGAEIEPLREPGSDDRLSSEAAERIAQRRAIDDEREDDER